MEERSSSKAKAIAAIIALVVVIAGAFAAYSVVSSSAQGGTASESAAFTRSESAAATTGGSSSDSVDSSASSSAGADGGWDSTMLRALTFEDTNGNEVMLGDVANGKVTVINVWATWCPYCVDEMQDFQDLYEKYGTGIQFIMLNAADSKTEVAQAHAYVQDEGFTFPVYYDAAWTAQRLFSVRAYPTTVVIDRDGSVLYNTAGRINTQSFDAGLGSLVG